MKTISVAEARAIDQDAVQRLGMPSILLMENAARGVADAARALGSRFVIYCGPGNNGGDGLAVARLLGRSARVYLLAEPDAARSPDAHLQRTILRNAGHPVTVGEVPPAAGADEVVIDALFGTGLSRGLTGAAADWVEAFNASPGRKLSVDIPSGLDGDRGVALGPACRAEVTVTFVAAKRGMRTAEARPYVGAIQVVGLGLPEENGAARGSARQDS